MCIHNILTGTTWTENTFANVVPSKYDGNLERYLMS